MRVKIGIFFNALFFLFVFQSISQAGTITLAWDPVTQNTAGYKLHYGTASRSYVNSVDVGNVTTYTFSELQERTVYYFSVTAYSAENAESDFSNEVFATAQAVLQTISLSGSELTLKSQHCINSAYNNYVSISPTSGLDVTIIFRSQIIDVIKGNFTQQAYKEVAVLLADGSIWIVPNDSAGPQGALLTEQMWFETTEFVPQKIARINFNRLGGDDIVIFSPSAGRMRIHINMGDCFFDNPIYDINPANGLHWGDFSSGWELIITGNFDGQYGEDIALRALATNNMLVFLANSDGTAIASRKLSGPIGSPNSKMYALDLDGDRKDDMLLFNQTTGEISACLSAGNYFIQDPVSKFVSLSAFQNIVPVEIISNGAKKEFLLCANQEGGTGNCILYQYDTTNPKHFSGFNYDNSGIWFNTHDRIL